MRGSKAKALRRARAVEVTPAPTMRPILARRRKPAEKPIAVEPGKASNLKRVHRKARALVARRIAAAKKNAWAKAAAEGKKKEVPRG